MILSTLKNIQDFWLHIKEMFVIIFTSKKKFSEFYSNRIDCLGNQLPKSYIDDETEELMDKEIVIQAYNSANLHLDEKVRNGKELKEKGYKLLGVLTTITLAVFGLAGFVYLNDDFTCHLKFFAIGLLFLDILWLFSVMTFLTEHLLKSVDYWHLGQLPENFINKQLLSWCNQENKNQEKHTLCFEINRIQDKIHFNEAENKRRLKVIDITLEHLIWFVLILIACIFLFMFCTI